MSDVLSNKWSELPYPGKNTYPDGLTPYAKSWPMFYFKRDSEGNFLTLDGEKVAFEIVNPCIFDFQKELKAVIDKSKNLTQKEIAIAKYWGNGVPHNQIIPIAMALINTYSLTPPRTGRVMGILNAALNDAFIITWFYKYKYDIPRPDQLKPDFKTVVATPYFPSYPSGHSVVSATMETILSYFFPSESKKLQALAEEASISRLYGGIHFICDLDEGLRLGRQIGKVIIEQVKKQFGEDYTSIDYGYKEFLDAPIIPDITSVKGTSTYSSNGFNNANFSPLSSYKRL